MIRPEIQAAIDSNLYHKFKCLKKREDEWSGTNLNLMSRAGADYLVQTGRLTASLPEKQQKARELVADIRAALLALASKGALCPRCEGPKEPALVYPPEGYKIKKNEAYGSDGAIIACEDCKP